MKKSLLIASFVVLTANTFGMGSDYYGESSGRRNSKPQFQEIRPAPIPYNELSHMCDQLFRMNEENKKLIKSQNNQIVVLNQQCLKAESLAQTLQIKNENQESLLRQKNDEISDWKDKYEKQRLATKVIADEVEKREKEIKKVCEEKEELESSLQEMDKKIEESESSLQEKDGKIKELTEQIEKLKQKIERDREKRRKLQEEKDADIENLMVKVLELERELEASLNSKMELTERSREKRRKSQKENADRKRAKVNSIEKSISKDKFTHLRSYHSDTYGNVALYRQSHYEKSNGSETPTTILVRSNGRPEKLESILEIRYANNVSHKKIADPKVILYRSNKDECYIVLKIDDKNYGIVYGLEERFIEIEKKSFSVYEVSKDMESFTDNVLRLIYVDNSGLYIVPAKGNPIEQVKEKYKEKGQFDFKGSILKVSAIDGSITINNKESFVNFYPPEGKYKGIYQSIGSFRNTSNWINSFVNIYTNEAKVKNGKFRSDLMTYLSVKGRHHKLFCDDLKNRVKAKGVTVSEHQTVMKIIGDNKNLFSDLDFVKSLKSIFAEEEKNCGSNKEIKFRRMFELVKNL